MLFRYFAPLVIFVICTINQFLGEAWLASLSFHVSDFAQGQWHSFLTAHLIHLNWNHYFMNMAGVGLVCWLAPNWLMDWRFFVILMVMMVFSSVGFMIWQVDYHYYGFSGVLYGWISLSILFSPYYSRLWRYLVPLGIAIKLLLDGLGFGLEGFSAELIESKVSLEAHVLGMVGAALVALGVIIKRPYLLQDESS